MLPRLVIDLEKLRHNACTLCAMTRERGISALAFVTKVFCADREMVRVLAQTPCRYLADSRIENLARCEGLGKERILLRLPMPSQAESVVRNAEISFNSELATLRALSTAAGKLGLVHKVVLMIDLGDLREGIFCENADAILQTAREIEHDCNLELYGAAFNVTCYGSVLPTTENLGVFLSLTRQIEAAIGRRLALISGGNSSSIPLLLSGNMQPDINNLRLGEALVLGRETAHGTAIDGLYQDVVTLEAEVVEVQTKPSYPVGITALNAFGEKACCSDIGVRRRAIAAIGRQDTNCVGLRPSMPGITVVGASSDHLILDVTQSAEPVAVGNVLRFNMDYGTLLRGFTSQYVGRTYV